MCEICNKGFQRDQNLQLHRRGHNLPWKLKQRGNAEVRKRVYVCPEPSCVHHNPARALGDLTGIKKHFSRKHGEKKWKCDKCNKKYAVQSDCKAHSKICGTKEYKCDCGTIFSRRDSFITHRAFCDALAEENHNIINKVVNIEGAKMHHHQGFPNNVFQGQPIPNLVVPSLPNNKNHNHNPPPLMVPITTMPLDTNYSTLPAADTTFTNSTDGVHHESGAHYLAARHNNMSATALLHKAAQLGGITSMPPPPSNNNATTTTMMMEHYGYNNNNNNVGQQHDTFTFHEDHYGNFNGIDGIGMSGVEMFNAILDQSKALSKIIEQNNSTSVNGSSSSCDTTIMMNGSKASTTTQEDHVMTLDLLGIGRGGGAGHGYFGPLA